jgi:hypothetical protein
MTSSVPPALDHLVYATPDLAATVAELETRTGVRAAPGGRHPGWGTMNALLSLGPRMYLEIIGPDPDQARPREGRLFGVDMLEEPRLVTWAARTSDLPGAVSAAAALGIDLGEIRRGSRQRTDGTLLQWALTDPRAEREGGVIPFFIDWGSSPHPADSAAGGCTLKALTALHPDPERIAAILSRLGIDLAVEPAPTPGLRAVANTPRGAIEL